MPITAENVKPFFQVLVYTTEEGFNLKALAKKIATYINAKNAKSYSNFKKKEILIDEDDLRAEYFQHIQHPSWFRIEPGKPLESDLKNREHDLLILFTVDSYLFVHSSCRSLAGRVADAIRLEKTNPPKLVNAVRIKRVLNNLDLKLNAIAIDNVYGSSGIAPEGKAYYSPDVINNLSVGTDSGFQMSYFQGRDLDNNSKPVGASASKRKVWKGFVENIDKFKEECSALAETLNQEPTVEKLSVLVNEIEPFLFQPDEIVAFNLSGYSEEKTIRLEYKDREFGDWSADLVLDEDNKVRVTLLPPLAREVTVDYEFAFDENENVFTFGTGDEDEVKVIFVNDKGNEYDNKINLSAYLNRGTGFTFLFTNGRAFRNGDFTEDNRFKLLFKKCDDKHIATWDDVLITREAKEEDLPADKITILSKIEQVALLENPKYIIRDDGAGEVADHLICFEDTLILAHAKASGGDEPAIRVSDLHIVCSQAVKNLRYFTFDAYSEETLIRIHGKIGVVETYEAFVSSFSSIFREWGFRKECWIVQPGISKAQLEEAPDNKIHSLLHYVDGMCSINGVIFKLICSP